MDYVGIGERPCAAVRQPELQQQFTGLVVQGLHAIRYQREKGNRVAVFITLDYGKRIVVQDQLRFHFLRVHLPCHVLVRFVQQCPNVCVGVCLGGGLAVRGGSGADMARGCLAHGFDLGANTGAHNVAFVQVPIVGIQTVARLRNHFHLYAGGAAGNRSA